MITPNMAPVDLPLPAAAAGLPAPRQLTQLHTRLLLQCSGVFNRKLPSRSLTVKNLLVTVTEALQEIPKIQRDRPKPSQNRSLSGDPQETRCETATEKTDVAICRHARSDGRFRKLGELPGDGNWQVL